MLQILRAEASACQLTRRTAIAVASSRWWIGAWYPALIAGGEAMVSLVSVPLGMLWHSVLVLVLLVHFIRMNQLTYSAVRRVIPVLALLPLLRVISVAIPLDIVRQLYWPAMIGAPILIAAVLLSRTLRLWWDTSGYEWRSWVVQGAIATSGLPLGLIAYFIAQPEPLSPALTWFDFVLGSIILIVFAALVEEFIFRGMLQHFAVQLFGTAGVLWSSVLFAAMYIGSLSILIILLMLCVGLLFGLYAFRTGSIWGVIGAHSVFKIGLVLGYPGLS